ncbi:hypothetical protein [Clostridium arbusti]|uniref:hypothetical protein n=1 Tax=Clostridium arbusti TaxID=1137848 RepID=UPI0002899DFA|nr:hypothetical protein [Clostridium arbusti]
MSKNGFLVMILLFIIAILLYSTVGIGVTTIILATGILIQAIVFTYKPVYYDRYLKFMNPSMYNVYIKKGDKFIKKKRKINIAMQYILFFILIFDGLMQIKVSKYTDIKRVYSTEYMKEYLIIGVVVVIILIVLINYIGKLIMKKSKTANEDFMWNIILGIILAIVLICAMSIFILNNVLR